MGPGFNYAWAERELGGRTTREILCPECSAGRKPENRKKRCLGLRNLGDGRITYKCLNCGVDGVVTEGWQEGPPRERWPTATIVPLKQPIHDDHDEQMSEWAGRVWDEGQNADGTIIEDYWRARFGSGVPIPRTIRFHPALRHDGQSHPCLLTAYGIQAPKHVTSIHRIFLKPDGSWHTGVKMAAGKHEHMPAVVHRNTESRALVIGEGLEKTVAAAFVMNCDGWAAGGLDFMPKLISAVGDDVECVTIIVDQGDKALGAAISMALELTARGIEYRAVRLPADPDVILQRDGVDRLRAMLDDPGYALRVESAPTVKGPRLIWESEALRLRQPQDWLVQDILERGYLYSLTGRSGSGKTAIALLISYLIAAADIFPRLLGTREVERGTVVFLAGENPVDVIRRMAGIRGHYKLVDQASIALVQQTFSIKDHIETIASQIPQDRPISLVVVDTAQAFFDGAEENSNSEMRAYAQTLRQLTKLPGGPSVLVLAHPAKFAASQADMLPRGGSAFLAEIDGNLTLWSDGDSEQVFELHHTDKLRGPGFEAIKIELIKYTDDSFVDTKGRPSYTVVAQVVTEAEAAARADAAFDTKTETINALTHAGEAGISQAQLLDILKATRPNTARSTAKRILDKLVSERLAERRGSLYVLHATKPRNTRNKKGQKDD